jgi:hypothetical protein
MNFTKDASSGDNTFVQFFNDFYEKDLTEIGIFTSIFFADFWLRPEKSFDQQTCFHDLLEWYSFLPKLILCWI